DWGNSYYTNTDENITGIWSFLKKCQENRWIKQAQRPMPWCPRCGTSLSEHEMTGSYKELEHASVFFKLPLKERPWDILVWTTTPWTLSANTALAVNPEIDYCVVDCEDKRPLVLAKSALRLIRGKKAILQYIKGSELEGLKYETCFPSLPVQRELEHKIVLWDMVSSEEGSGVVHIAPGCGAEDFELGQKLGLPSICPVDEYGSFLEGYEWLTGLKVSEAPEVIFAKLQAQGKLFLTQNHSHSYPVCWRCKTEVIFRLVKEWYISTEEIKPRLKEAAATVKWEPEHVGKRMQDWLENMGDWSISRKRFYGLPLPFYPCKKCGKLTVVGSKEELRALGGTEVDKLRELHRPWIDDIKIKCPHCGGEVERISEVGDVWLDAGITPFSTMGYFKDRAEWEKQFPAEWVTEMIEQVRLWFYSLLFMSVTFTGRAPYERVLAYGSVVAEDGTRFSKTGFMIKFDEAAEKLGSDAVRYLFAGANTSSDVRFGYNLGEEARRKLLAFWNVYSFFMTYAALEKPCLKSFNPAGKLDATDRWLLARTDRFIQEATSSLENYKTSEVIKAFDNFTEDMSNWYVRVNRRRFWKQEQNDNKLAAYWCLFNALKAAVQVMAPIIPFMTEHMWQNMVRCFESSSEESVHLSRWPQPFNLADGTVLKDMEPVRKLVALVLKLRNEKQLKVRQPLSAMYVSTDADTKAVINNMRNIIKEELNIKEIVFLEDFSNLKKRYLVLNFKSAGAELKENLKDVKHLLEQCNDDEISEMLDQFDSGASIKIPGWDKALESRFFLEKTKYDEDYAVAGDGHTEIALRLALNEELMLEGLYRELLRQCQLLRKEAGLRVEQKIVLGIKSDSRRINEVVKSYEKSICGETLAIRIVEAIDCPIVTEEVNIDGNLTVLQISDKLVS
ncbi:MAG: class I tRNA ligase family protein, partial [Bacillota bacterium]|nr:class I tRNA ligase family protein [Bacillota bacterium]